MRRSTFTIGFCFFRNYDCLPNLLDPILTWTRCYQWPIPFKYANTYQDSKQLHEHNQSFMVEPWLIVVLLVQGWDSKTDCMPWMSGAETDPSIRGGELLLSSWSPMNLLPLLLNSFWKGERTQNFLTQWSCSWFPFGILAMSYRRYPTAYLGMWEEILMFVENAWDRQGCNS